MIMSKWLCLFVSIGLVAGCTVGRQGQHTIEPRPTVSSLPTPPRDSGPVSVPETPEASMEEAAPYVLPLDEPEPQQPPADDAPARTIVGMARADLARRLGVGLEWVEVVEVTAREPDTEVMLCLAGDATPEPAWADLDEVQWITLSVKGKVYRYVGLVDLVSYCDEYIQLPDRRVIVPVATPMLPVDTP
jgi:hypothetical protein